MANCENCAEKCAEIEKKDTPEVIPYIVYEAEMTRAELRRKEELKASTKREKRWMIAFFVALAMLFSLATGFIVYEAQFETISYKQDGEGINNVNIGEQGNVGNGAESNVQEEENKG